MTAAPNGDTTQVPVPDDDVPAPGERRALSIYERGKTAYFACRYDERLSYCLYVPERPWAGPGRRPVVALIHGSARSPHAYRDQFVDFADRHGCIVLTPLFPCGLVDPTDQSNYKFVEFGGIRFDLALLSMIDSVAEKYDAEAERVLLFGFSGGGQFVHRFFMLHPRRLRGVSIGAPGTVTLLDPARPYWTGIADLEARFGIRPDPAAMAAVPCQMVVGAADTETWEITITPKSRHWMPGANAAGVTRIDRLRSLEASYRAAGIAVRFDLVPHVAHQGFDVLGPVRSFFAEILGERGR
jgi:pimeloyl-ACP methyl ester carboxylesterase